MTEFSYARLDESQAEAWRLLRLEGTRAFPLGFLITPEEADIPPEEARRVIAAGGVRGLFTEGRLIGFAGFHRERLIRTRHRATLGPFFVSPTFHGTGAAAVLLRGIVREARTHAISQLELYVDTENRRALAFYEKHGFTRVARHPGGVMIDGTPRDDYFCIRTLQP